MATKAMCQPGLGCCRHCTVVRRSHETSVEQSQERTQGDTTGRDRVVEMASLPAQGFIRQKTLWEGIKPSRSKQGGEIGQLSTIEDVANSSPPEVVPVQPATALGCCMGVVSSLCSAG